MTLKFCFHALCFANISSARQFLKIFMRVWFSRRCALKTTHHRIYSERLPSAVHYLNRCQTTFPATDKIRTFNLPIAEHPQTQIGYRINWIIAPPDYSPGGGLITFISPWAYNPSENQNFALTSALKFGLLTKGSYNNEAYFWNDKYS